ncbi:MAG: SPOR domain-containing protein [Rhodobacteraceae bacterium]|nr:SPOR domain-containing protein [Paracoccaceae bacterium]
MADEKEHPTSGFHPQNADESGDVHNAAEDPLVELARIVNRNRQDADAGQSEPDNFFAGLSGFGSLDNVSPASEHNVPERAGDLSGVAPEHEAQTDSEEPHRGYMDFSAPQGEPADVGEISVHVTSEAAETETYSAPAAYSPRDEDSAYAGPEFSHRPVSQPFEDDATFESDTTGVEYETQPAHDLEALQEAETTYEPYTTPFPDAPADRAEPAEPRFAGDFNFTSPSFAGEPEEVTLQSPKHDAPGESSAADRHVEEDQSRDFDLNFAEGKLSADVMMDLENSLTAELEDELLGALRSRVEPSSDDVSESVSSYDPSAHSYSGNDASELPEQEDTSFEDHTSSMDEPNPYGAQPRESDLSETGVASGHLASDRDFGTPYDYGLEPRPEERPIPAPTPRAPEPATPRASQSTSLEDDLAASLGSAFGLGGVRRDTETPKREPFSFGSDLSSTSRSSERSTTPSRREPRAPFSPPSAAETAAATRPASTSSGFVFNDDDLFAGEDEGHTAPAPTQTRASARMERDLAAELGLPQEAFDQHSDSDNADDIDNMTWPAAAAALPTDHDEDTPPPPEGYDLDAVARAMHAGDPTLSASLGDRGVLAPEPDAPKRKVTYKQERKSGKGLLAAVMVLGVAVVGGGAFYFFGTGGSSVPDGPPPVIAGLDKELKVFPETQTADNSDSAKLIFDRVDGNNGEGQERLILPEKTTPAELPPAPATISGSDELVPTGPKKVRTLVVRPDGSIVTEEKAPTRVVSTTPATSAPVPQAPSVPATAASAESVPAAPAAEQAPVAPQGPIVTTLPQSKPAAPVRTAQAQPAQTAPVKSSPVQVTPVQTNPAPAVPRQVSTTPVASNNTSGPLNLTAPTANTSVQTPAPAATAPTVTSTSGSIPAGTYIVQVTSQRSEAAARETYAGLKRRFPSVLGNRDAVIVSAVVEDRGTFYRARIPTGSRDEAISLCESLQAAGGDCFVRRN